MQLLEAGNNVVATCRSPQKAQALHSLASNHQGRLVILPLDVNDEASVQVMHCPTHVAYHSGVHGTICLSVDRCMPPHEPGTAMRHT